MIVPNHVLYWIQRKFPMVHDLTDYTRDELRGLITSAESLLNHERPTLASADYDRAKFEFHIMRERLGMKPTIYYDRHYYYVLKERYNV